MMLSCKEPVQKTTLNDFDWLLGTWQGISRTGNVFYEEWILKNDTLMANVNYHFEGSEKKKGGSSEIILRNNKLFYINKSDSLKPLEWESVSHTATSMTFFNPNIKPYNRITFSLSEHNTWDAILAGTQDTFRYSLNRKMATF
mgnify:CR=1 FL=1